MDISRAKKLKDLEFENQRFWNGTSATTNLYSRVTEGVVAQEIGCWINEQDQQSSNKVLELAL